MKNNINLGIQVGDIMTRNFVSTVPEIPVLTAVKLMVKNRVGSLIIQENGILKGMLTEKDIMWALNKKNDLREIKAKDICTRKITTIRPSADLYDAILLMKKKKFRRLPVTIKKKVIGLLTLKDILRIEPELFKIAQEGYTIRDYPQKLKRLEQKQSGHTITEGFCDNCGYFNILTEKNGRLVCEACKEEIET